MADIICYYLSIEWMAELSRFVERASTIQIGKRTQSMGGQLSALRSSSDLAITAAAPSGAMGGENLAWPFWGHWYKDSPRC